MTIAVDLGCKATKQTNKTLCIQAGKALACIHICADSPDPKLLEIAISTKNACAGSN